MKEFEAEKEFFRGWHSRWSRIILFLRSYVCTDKKCWIVFVHEKHGWELAVPLD